MLICADPLMLLAFMRQINVAIIGGGTVGGGVYKALRQNGRLLASRLGFSCRLRVLSPICASLCRVDSRASNHGLEIGGRG